MNIQTPVKKLKRVLQKVKAQTSSFCKVEPLYKVMDFRCFTCPLCVGIKKYKRSFCIDKMLADLIEAIEAIEDSRASAEETVGACENCGQFFSGMGVFCPACIQKKTELEKHLWHTPEDKPFLVGGMVMLTLIRESGGNWFAESVPYKKSEDPDWEGLVEQYRKVHFWAYSNALFQSAINETNEAKHENN